MKTNELRVGNLTDKGVIMGITPRYGLFGFGDTAIKWHEINPIPLTKEWLLKFGFEYIEYRSKFQMSGNFDFQIYDNDIGYQLMYGNVIPNVPIIKYVHQLQNLYFALIGEELKLKQVEK